MASEFGILDIRTLTKQTWDIYKQCHPLTKDAPDGFRELVQELGSLQASLRGLSNDLGSDTMFFDSMSDERKHTLERSVSACFPTLQLLKALLKRYRELGVGDENQFWQKVEWATQQTQVESITQKIMVHTCNLTLCMSPGNASLIGIEHLAHRAVEEEKSALGFDVPSRHSLVVPRTVRGGFSVELEDTSQNIRARMASQRALSPLHLRSKHVSVSSESMISGSDSSAYSGTAPGTPLSTYTARSISRSLLGRANSNQARNDQLFHGGSVVKGAPSGIFGADTRELHEKDAHEKASESTQREPTHTVTADATTSAIHQLLQVRSKEQLARPLRYEPRNALQKPDVETMKFFETFIKEEPLIANMTTKDWLRMATWWLLKARVTFANCNKHAPVSARDSVSPSIDSRTSSNQAYVDLLKVSYILYDVVLSDGSSPTLLSDENRKSIADLSEAINEELSQYTAIDIPETLTLHAQNLNIWESLQPEEALGTAANTSPTQDSARWITVDQDDAGSEEEKVLYRTFVNAGIGGKKIRMRTKGAPYMLLLATKEESTEPQIILCNQSGSLCLQRHFVPEDLAPLLEPSNPAPNGLLEGRIFEPIPLKFGATSVSISFQFEADLGHFVNIPKTYFDVVSPRDPIDSKEFTESVIFQSSIEQFELLRTPNMNSMSPPVITRACELRILERSFGEAWQSTRRMVISPSAAEKTPQCIEFFMPLSRVQISREDVSRQVRLKWSDTCQKRSDKTDGNHTTLYSFVYDDKAPNIGVALHFRTQQAAENFEKAILELNFRPDFAWSQPSSSGRVYDVIDTDTERKHYKAVVLIQNQSSWRYSDVYYLYRDTDYAYDNSSLSVRFPRAYFTDYISTHVNQLIRTDDQVGFSHCEKRSDQVIIEFNNDTVSRSFISSLSPLYELQYSRRVHSLTTRNHKSLFGPKKSAKGRAEIQLWRRGNGFQLAVRWGDHVPEKWLTMTLSPDCSEFVRESDQIVFPKMAYTRGSTLDMMNILARSPKSNSIGNREGSVSITFRRNKDRDEFLAVLQGRPLSTFMCIL